MIEYTDELMEKINKVDENFYKKHFRPINHIFAFAEIYILKGLKIEKMLGKKINFKFILKYIKNCFLFFYSYVIKRQNTYVELYYNDVLFDFMYNGLNEFLSKVANIYKEENPSVNVDNLNNIEIVLYFNNRLDKKENSKKNKRIKKEKIRKQKKRDKLGRWEV